MRTSGAIMAKDVLREFVAGTQQVASSSFEPRCWDCALMGATLADLISNLGAWKSPTMAPEAEGEPPSVRSPVEGSWPLYPMSIFE